MSKLPRLALSAALALFLLVSPSFAGKASDAYKEAKKRAEAAQRAETDEDREAQMADLQDWVRSKSKSLLAADPGRMDIGYVGRMQSAAGLYDDAIATLEKALADTRKTKYESYLHLFYVKALLGAEQYDKAFSAFQKMHEGFSAEKNTKIAAMDVGMALRSQRRWKESAFALDAALKMKNPRALKPLVNSLLMEGQKDAATAAVQFAIEKAGAAGADEAHPILLELIKSWGEAVPFDVDAYAPGPAPDLSGKVVVMGFWNVSAGTLRWTMETLQYLFESFPPVDGVETLAVTTYYKKNPESGKIEEDMTPETERELGLGYRTQWNFQGQLAYLKDRAAMQALGCSAFPCIVVLGKDGRLLYSNTVNRRDPTEIDVIADIIKKAAGK